MRSVIWPAVGELAQCGCGFELDEPSEQCPECGRDMDPGLGAGLVLGGSYLERFTKRALEDPDAADDPYPQWEKDEEDRR